MSILLPTFRYAIILSAQNGKIQAVSDPK